MLALILHFDSTPMHIGSKLRWFILAGMIMRPRATSERIVSAVRSSRLATYSISPVIVALAGIVNLGSDLIALAGRNPLITLHVPIIGWT